MTNTQEMLTGIEGQILQAKSNDAMWEQMPATLDARTKGIEEIIQEARKDARGVRDGLWNVYEYHKRRLDMLWLGPDLYEQSCRSLATALNL